MCHNIYNSQRFSKKIYQILFFLLLTGWTAESTYAQATRLGDTIYLDRISNLIDPFTVSSSNDGSRISIGSPGNPAYIYEYNNSSWEETIIDNRDELLLGDTTTLTPHNQQHSTTDFNNNGTRVAIGYSSIDISGPFTSISGLSHNFVKIYQRNQSGGWDSLGSRIQAPISRSTINSILTGNNGDFAFSIDISGDGSRIAVGAPQTPNVIAGTGSVQIYEWDGSQWNLLGSPIQLSRTNSGNNNFGYAVKLSDDGNNVYISDPGGTSPTATGEGYVDVYQWSGSAWQQRGRRLKASTEEIGSESLTRLFGVSIDVEATGDTLIVGGYVRERNGETFAVYNIFEWNEGVNDWESSDIEVPVASSPSNDFENRYYYEVAISSDGKKVAVSANVGGGQVAVYQKTKADNVDFYEWTLSAQFKAPSESAFWGDPLSLGDKDSVNDYRLIVGAKRLTRNGSLSLGVTVFENEFKNRPIEAINLSPIRTYNDSSAVVENVAEETVIANLTLKDADIRSGTNTYTYSLMGPDADSFRINGTQIVTASAIDFETKPSYEIMVTASDGFLEYSAKPTTIVVLNERNESGNTNDFHSPTDLDIKSLVPLTTDLDAGSALATFMVSDRDDGDTYTFAIAGTTAEDYFIITEDTLKLRIDIDQGTRTLFEHTLEVTVTDSDGETYGEPFTLSVIPPTSVNENSGSENMMFSRINYFHDFSYDGNRLLTIINNNRAEIQEWNGFAWNRAGNSINLGTSIFRSERFFNQPVVIDSAGTRVVIGINEERGKVRVYDWDPSANEGNGDWILVDTLKSSKNGQFGGHIDLSNDGKYLAVSDLTRDRLLDNQVTVYQWNAVSNNYELLGDTVRHINSELNMQYDDVPISSLAINNRGDQLFVGYYETPGILGAEIGAVVVYDLIDGNWQWTQELAGGRNLSSQFGNHLSLSDDGNRLAIGANNHHMVYIYDWDAARETWSITATLTEAGRFGRWLELSADGYTLAVGAPQYSGGGRVFIYQFSNNQWIETDRIIPIATAQWGTTVHLSGNGNRIATGEGFNNQGIKVYDVNRSPTEIIFSPNAGSFSEDLPIGTAIGTLTTTDLDEGNTHRYTVMDPTGLSYFGVDSGTNILKVDTFLDYESLSNGMVMFSVQTHDGVDSLVRDFSVTITDANDAPDAIRLTNLTDVVIDTIKVTENSGENFVVGTLSTLDQDTVDTHTYGFANSNDNILFNIFQDTLRTSQSFNAEAGSNYEISVTSTEVDNRPNLSVTRLFTIEIMNINEAPSDITLNDPNNREIAVDSIAENQPVGSVVGILHSVDDDEVDAHTYTLSGRNASSFRIFNDSILQTTEVFDSEGISSYIFNITSTDVGGDSLVKEFTIRVTNVNEKPTDITLEFNNMPLEENEPARVIGVVNTTDPDNGDVHTYSIDEALEEVFEIAEGTGQFRSLSTKKPLNFEEDSVYMLTITSTDSGDSTFTKTLTITVLDRNDAPSGISILTGDNRIAENQNVGAEVFTFGTEDEDAGDTHTYTLGGTDSSAFSLDNTRLLTAAVFMRSVQSRYEITITTNDGAAAYDSTFTIEVTGFSHPPTGITLTETIALAEGNIVVTENTSEGTTLAVLNTDDIDPADSHTYTLINDENLPFTLTDATLKTSGILNFEDSSSYEITIRTDDGSDNGTYDSTFTITILDQNEPPTAILLLNTMDEPVSSIEENQPIASVVGRLSSVDDDTNDTHTYALSGADTSNFNIVENGEMFELQTTQLFNHEDDSSYMITITTTEAKENGLTYDSTFTIQVVNVNENPTDIVLRNSNTDMEANNIAENEPAGTAIGILSTVDEDNEDTHTYTLEEGRIRNIFEIVNDTLKAKISLNFEEDSVYMFNIITTDSGDSTSTFTKPFTLMVTDVNDPPASIRLSDARVAEGLAIGSEVAIIMTTDEDTEEINYELSGEDSSLFTLSADTLKTNLVFTFDAADPSANRHDIIITASDGENELATSFTIEITRISEPPTDIMLTDTTIVENAEIGTKVGLLTTTDPDDDTHTYTLIDDENVPFTIIDDTLQTSEILNFEDSSSYEITIRTDDGSDKGTYDETFTIIVVDQNEAPTTITLSNDTIAEDASIGTVVGRFSTEDPDRNNRHTYTITDTENTAFEITGDTLQTKSTLDFETARNIILNIRLDDGGVYSITETFIIRVRDANEPPTTLTLSSTSVAENADIGTMVGRLSAMDENMDTSTYTLGGTDASAFSISNEVLQTAEVFDLETKASYVISITADDGNGGMISENFTISITNVNEDPTDINLSNNTVAENAENGTTVGMLTTIDPDEGDTHTYTLGGTDVSAFSISNSTLQTAEVFDLETKASYAISITTDDGNNGTFSKDFTIEIRGDSILSINELYNLTEILPIFVEEVFTLTINHPFKGQVEMIIYALDGSIARTSVYEKVSERLSQRVNMSHFPSGVYIVHIHVGDRVEVKKIVKK